MMIGSGWFFLITVLGSYITFFMAQWEEHHTGVMELGYVGVAEIQFMTCGFYLLSYFFTPSFWLQEFEVFGHVLQYNNVPEIVIASGVVFTVFGNVLNVATCKSANKLVAVKQLFPITFLTVGFIFAYITGRIVVNRVCGEEFSVFHPIQLG